MEGTSQPRLQVQLVHGSFFCIMPTHQHDQKAQSGHPQTLVPRWYSGDIYDLQHPPQIVDLPIPPSSTSPTEYDIYISGDYEVRFVDFVSRSILTSIRSGCLAIPEHIHTVISQYSASTSPLKYNNPQRNLYGMKVRMSPVISWMGSLLVTHLGLASAVLMVGGQLPRPPFEIPTLM